MIFKITYMNARVRSILDEKIESKNERLGAGQFLSNTSAYKFHFFYKRRQK